MLEMQNQRQVEQDHEGSNSNGEDVKITQTVNGGINKFMPPVILGTLLIFSSCSSFSATS